ncbi:MAG: alpha/beta fold hydrolase [Brasilonema octagenarum HA4186-MV1]|jgi:pimeloyl-ACP methyl ester carboxylesterase|uniref:Alpha/beta hydrolase n=2 Tax=Brasilonema TaxID=383614 RepID=A0A856MCA5_9CYAN|nr:MULTISPECIES: alpha/beta fold hydrolase [Brasilonema]MBW4626732.1 alpha/beta fold hydrolase [Brasilonema octagenarum HA4186-MV1]NMF64258.1 alpha/beta hydrolase [Brasilonema octagenarum UFV-OR1]QDL07729.1 alpha/beta hydrolase [Brasilonema sennae CENA114]QDL14091.1 alpha/beta hydrolase [Brasilonema octagenarum UFV-E1]
MTTSASTPAFTSTKTWIWQGFPISYQTQGTTGPAVILVHGFGASWWHWRKNIPVLAEHCRVYAIDLIGFGASAKPKPNEKIAYTIETWGQQVADFCREVVGEPAYFVANSIGCIVVMQAAVSYSEVALGVALLNCSLRLLHDRKRATLPWHRRFGAPILQRVLSVKLIGDFFFNQVAKPKTVRKILLQAYADSQAVTEELVDILTTPARDPGAVAVFLAFTSYSSGPLPEDLLPQLSCPAIMLWGTVDPWEPVELGRELANFAQVQKFFPLEGVGHCPQDEVPEVVNPIIQDWIFKLTR